jgi:hypothetical protein
MKNRVTTKTSTIQRTKIEDLSHLGVELSDEELQLASGGLTLRPITLEISDVTTSVAASCTLNDDTDWRQVD